MQAIRFGLCGLAASLLLWPGFASAQQRTGAGVTAGAAGGGAAAGNRANTGQIDSAAGSSEQVSRDFGNGLVGRGDTSTRFVGSQAASTQTGQAQVPTNFQNLNRQRATQSQPTGNPIRARLVIGFDAQLLTGSTTVRISDVAATARSLDRVSPSVNYQILPTGVALLTGNAGSERDRKLAEALVRLEPGVRRVDNQIQVTNVTPPLP